MIRNYYDSSYDDPSYWPIYGYPGWAVWGDDAYIEDDCFEERWLPIYETKGKYWVSDYARVWSSATGHFLKVKPMDKHGHLGVCLYVNGKRLYRYIHRLVAQAFIENPDGCPVVRHILDNPDLNCPEDLEWGTQRDNAMDALRNGRTFRADPETRRRIAIEQSMPIIATNIKTGERLRFIGQSEAARILGLQQANIWKVLNGQRRHSCGWTFEYEAARRNNGREYY